MQLASLLGRAATVHHADLHRVNTSAVRVYHDDKWNLEASCSPYRVKGAAGGLGGGMKLSETLSKGTGAWKI